MAPVEPADGAEPAPLLFALSDPLRAQLSALKQYDQSSNLLVVFSDFRKGFKREFGDEVDIFDVLDEPLRFTVLNALSLSGRVKPKLESLEKSPWNLDAHALTRHFGSGALFSERFLAALVKLSKLSAPFEHRLEELRHCKRMRTERKAADRNFHAVPVGAQWCPWDVQEVLKNASRPGDDMTHDRANDDVRDGSADVGAGDSADQEPPNISPSPDRVLRSLINEDVPPSLSPHEGKSTRDETSTSNLTGERRRLSPSGNLSSNIVASRKRNLQVSNTMTTAHLHQRLEKGLRAPRSMVQDVGRQENHADMTTNQDVKGLTTKASTDIFSKAMPQRRPFGRSITPPESGRTPYPGLEVGQGDDGLESGDTATHSKGDAEQAGSQSHAIEVPANTPEQLQIPSRRQNDVAYAVNSLDPQQWLSVTALDELLRTFASDGFDIIDPQWVDLTKSDSHRLPRGLPSESSHSIVLPFLHACHFSVALLNLEHRTVDFYDSYALSDAESLVKPAVFKICADARLNTSSPSREWTFRRQNWISQDNTYDCGVLAVAVCIYKFANVQLPARTDCQIWRYVLQGGLRQAFGDGGPPAHLCLEQDDQVVIWIDRVESETLATASSLDLEDAYQLHIGPSLSRASNRLRDVDEVLKLLGLVKVQQQECRTKVERGIEALEAFHHAQSAALQKLDDARRHLPRLNAEGIGADLSASRQVLTQLRARGAKMPQQMARTDSARGTALLLKKHWQTWEGRSGPAAAAILSRLEDMQLEAETACKRRKVVLEAARALRV